MTGRIKSTEIAILATFAMGFATLLQEVHAAHTDSLTTTLAVAETAHTADDSGDMERLAIAAPLDERKETDTSDPLTRPVSEAEAAHMFVISRLEKFAAFPSAAWPIVREYLWETHFGDSALFLGYAHSMPGNERSDHLTFKLMVHSGAWHGLSNDARRAILAEAERAVAATLSTFNLKGALEITVAHR